MDILGPRSQTLGTWLAFFLAAGWALYELRKADQLPTGATMSNRLLPVLLIATLLITAAMHVIAAVINRRRPEGSADKSRRSSGEKRVSTVPLARQRDTSHEDCQTQIRTLESTISRLQRNEQDHGVLISGKETHIEQLQAELAGLGWLQSIAFRQNMDMERYVRVRCLLLEHSLIQEPLLIHFRLGLYSSSVYELSATGLSGSIRIGNRRLGTAVPVDYSPRIVSNEMEGIAIGETGHLTISQPLTREDAVFILNADGEFFFDGLFIELNTFPKIERPIKLSLVDSISNKAVREAYPKLAIRFKSATYFSIADQRNLNAPELNYLITIDLTIENQRSAKVDIDSIELSVMTLGGRFPTMQPEHGDIYDGRFIDGSGNARTLGNQLKNLAGFPLSIIGRGKVSGCFQFSMEAVALGVLGEATATLILTDKYGERHVGNQDLTTVGSR